MADNMIELVAKLDTVASEEQIKRDISTHLNGKLYVDVACKIDTTSIDSLRRQLSELPNNIKINIPEIKGDISKNITNKTVDEFNSIFGIIGKVGDESKREFNAQTKQMLQDFKSAWQNALTTGDFKPYQDALDKLSDRIQKFSKGDIQQLKNAIDEIRSRFTDGSAVSIGKDLMGWLERSTGSNGQARQYLDAVYGRGNYTVGNGNVGYDTFLSGNEDIAESIIKAGQKILEYQSKIKQQGWGLDEMEQLGASAEEVAEHIQETLRKIVGLSELPKSGDIVELLGAGDLDDVVSDVEKIRDTTKDMLASGEVELFDMDNIDLAEKKLKDIAIPKGESTKSTLDASKSILNSFYGDEGNANRIKRAIEDTEGELQRFYVQVERNDKSVETLTFALNEQGEAYEFLSKTIREADNSTDFRRKGLDVQKQIQSSNLEKFAAQVEKSGVSADSLNDRIKKLKEQISNINDNSDMNAFLDDLDIAKAQFQALNNIARKDNFAVSLSNKIKKLSADMQAYATNNKRAIDSTKQMSDGTSFATKWADLTSRMAKGASLSASELKHLGEEFRIFGKEAEAAGLKGESSFGKFLNSFKTMSSYITANMAFSLVKRQLREMADEVIAVDRAMTELRKVTEATEADFRKFAQSAAQTGKQLGASISDVINATSTFSRAGFSLPDAEELGRIATLYKNVGDGIDIDSASESIISVMKAFNIEAQEAERIIDRINKVSNTAAIDSQGLGLALQRVASAMRSANNTLDETIALTTVANEIVQNPEMVAQGWRTVALRIRGAKAELESAGLETEGMVESTAKLRDLIKGISGVDIMIDENTFKSTYQIISELGKVWDSISDINQASLLEAIAGRFYLNVQKCA